MSDRPNTPLPDQLADVRARIKSLQEQEAALKSQLLAHPELRTGAEWIVEIRTVQQQQVDWKELRANHGDIVEQYSFPREITRVELAGIDEHGELIPARRFRAAAQETAQ